MQNVLILDEDRRGSEAIAQLLRQAGHEVLMASDPFAALELVRTGHVKAIVLDVLLTGRGGIRFLQDLRSLPPGRDLPVFVWSLLRSGALLQEAAALGVRRCFVKGQDDPARLLEALHAI